jgi:hypothetical protein
MTTDYEANYIDVDAQRNQKVTSFKETVLVQFERCQLNGSVEMSRGGKREVVINGVHQDVIMPDNIGKYCESVITLEVTLTVKIRLFLEKNKEKDYIVKILNKINELEKMLISLKQELKNNALSLYNHNSSMNEDNLKRKCDLVSIELHREKCILIVNVLDDLGWLEERRNIAR